ncbi:MAG: type III pantothenate kinase [Christensenellaceae bacterium]|nr:type III pantothenate kinase [Christensenellaceae bacterium]
MLIVMDIGNTNIKCGIFEGGKLTHSWRMHSKREQSSDELGIKMMSFFDYLGLSKENVCGIMISSVIPSINYTVEHMCRVYFGRKPYFVEPGIKTGINILYDNPKELGSDRIVNAVAAYELYGGPCITVDFGTATSFGAISEKGEFLGGAICPGIKITAEALTQSTAKLPRIELTKPQSVINKNTVGCMQAGILYGYVGQVDYILRTMKAELGGNAKVVATGGMANVIAAETKTIDVIDTRLTLQGLYLIYKRNIGEKA